MVPPVTLWLIVSNVNDGSVPGRDELSHKCGLLQGLIYTHTLSHDGNPALLAGKGTRCLSATQRTGDEETHGVDLLCVQRL